MTPLGRKLRLLTANLAGATVVAYLLLPNLRFFLETGRLVVLLFVLQRVWVGLMFVIRRPPRTASSSPLDWIVAYGGWFSYLLLRPGGAHVAWALAIGFWVQILGMALWVWAFSKLSRSFGLVAADRGLVTRGPYAVVRHPLYSAYMIGGIGYLMQNPSIRNAVVNLIAVGCQLVRIRAEERHLEGPSYVSYRQRARWRLCPGLW